MKGIGRLDLATPKAQALLSGDAPTDGQPETRAVVDIRKHWLNTNAFLARLWALDVQDEAFFAIACMRMDLEPLTLSDRKSTRLNSSHSGESRMPSSA